MNLLMECGKREQTLRIKKEELIKKYSFSIDNKVLDTFIRAYGALAKRLQAEWSDRRNLTIIQDLLEKYDKLNSMMEIEATFPSVEETKVKIEEMIFPKKKTKTVQVSSVEISDSNSIADILQYKSTAQITKMLNNTDASLTKYKPYVGLSKEATVAILKAVYSVCTKEKKTLIDKFLGGK